MEKILIIEDDRDSYCLLENLLINIGFKKESIGWCTLIEEVRKVGDPAVDVILADLGLPDSPAHETFRKIQESFPYTPVVVLTGSSEVAFALETIKQGAQDYLVKGDLGKNDIERALRYAVQRKKAANDYQRLFDENPAPMYIYEEGTYRFLTANRAALNQYGYSREEFVQLGAADIRLAEDVALFEAADKTVSDNYSDFGTWRHVRKNGEVFYVQIYAHNTVFKGKRAAIVIALNIDKKVVAEKALVKKNKEVGNILESITDGFYAVDTNWNITYFNKEAERILGEKRADVIGRNIWEYFPEVRKEGDFFEIYHRAVRDRVSIHFEQFYAPISIWVSITVYPTDEGLAVYFVDITDQKKAQDKLVNDRQNLHAIINNTKDIIWSIGKDLNIISANDSFRARVGNITGKEMSHVNMGDFTANMYTAWKDYFDRAFAGEAFTIIWTDEKNGTKSYEEVSFNPIIDEEGRTTGASCFSRDVTQQHLYLEMIEKQNTQLRDIAWIQSHKVRGPVATIMGLIEVLNTQDPTDPSNVDLLHNIKEAAANLDVVIRTITAHATSRS